MFPILTHFYYSPALDLSLQTFQSILHTVQSPDSADEEDLLIAGRGHCSVWRAPKLYHNIGDPVIHLQEDSKGVRSPPSLILVVESALPEDNMG